MKLAVLFSGGGRTLNNLSNHFDVIIALTNRPDAGGIGVAQANNIPVYTISNNNYMQYLKDVDLIALAGFTQLFLFPKEFRHRVLNIHPALLPAFGGKGFYGDKVHEAVLKSGAQYSGCTVHFVNEQYDQGPIVLQRIVKVCPSDTVRMLADRVFAQELIAYPQAINEILQL